MPNDTREVREDVFLGHPRHAEGADNNCKQPAFEPVRHKCQLHHFHYPLRWHKEHVTGDQKSNDDCAEKWYYSDHCQYMLEDG